MSAESTTNPLAELRGAGSLMMVAGAISVGAGLLAIAYPDITLTALAIFAGVNVMLLGILALADAFAPSDDEASTWSSALLGVLGLIAGLVILRRPGEALVVLLLVLSIWLVVSGALQFFRALTTVQDRALLMFVAICEIVLGVLILSVPDLSLRAVAIFAGIGFILRGAMAIYVGWQLRKGAAPAARIASAA